MKIAVITLNPGIDRIIYLSSSARLGTMNRAEKTLTCQGSKGANVAIIFKSLGADPDYFSFTGGVFGSVAESFTAAHGIRSHFFPTVSGVRVNTKIIDSDGVCSEFNERGGPVGEGELEPLINCLFSEDYDIVILTGSIPQAVEKHVYNRIIKHFCRPGVLTILDADGDVMTLGLEARPSLIKPNRRELAGILGMSENALDTPDRALEGCRTVRKKYGCDVICTLEERGSVFCGESGEYKIPAADIPLQGFSGAGDTYLAAYVYKRYVECRPTHESLLYASAAAGAKIALPGTALPDKEQIEAGYRIVTSC